MNKYILIIILVFFYIVCSSQTFERYYSDSNNIVIDLKSKGTFLMYIWEENTIVYGKWQKIGNKVVFAKPSTYSDTLTIKFKVESKFYEHIVETVFSDSIMLIENNTRKEMNIGGMIFRTYNRRLCKKIRTTQICWNNAGPMYYVECSKDSCRREVYKKYNFIPLKNTLINYTLTDWLFTSRNEKRINKELGTNWKYYFFLDQMVCLVLESYRYGYEEEYKKLIEK